MYICINNTNCIIYIHINLTYIHDYINIYLKKKKLSQLNPISKNQYNSDNCITVLYYIIYILDLMKLFTYY